MQQQSDARAWFALDLKMGTLRWSDGMHHLYGYLDKPAAVSMSLLGSHKHPADLPGMYQLLRLAETRLESYVYEHRIITAADSVKTIVVAAAPMKVIDGRATVISGTAIDLTQPHRGQSLRDQPTVESLLDQLEDMQERLESRDVIGQAKGILMHTHGITAKVAFARLFEASQRRQRPVRAIAAEVVATGALDADVPLETEGVGEDPGTVPAPDEATSVGADSMPEHQADHDSKIPALEDEPDPDEMPRGQYGPTADYGDG